jgi:hypothetical protein
MLVRLAGIFCALRNDPSHDVGNILCGHGFPRHVVAPVRSAQFGAAHEDDSSEALIADESKIGSIHN